MGWNFRFIFVDFACTTDFVVFGGREEADLHENRDVTKSKDNASGGLYIAMGLVNTQNDFGASKAPAGLDLLMIGAKLDELAPPVTEIWEVDLLSLDALNISANFPNLS